MTFQPAWPRNNAVLWDKRSTGTGTQVEGTHHILKERLWSMCQDVNGRCHIIGSPRRLLRGGAAVTGWLFIWAKLLTTDHCPVTDNCWVSDETVLSNRFVYKEISKSSTLIGNNYFFEVFTAWRDVGVWEERRPKLTNGEIIFEVFKPIWSQFINVTDGRTANLP